MALDICTPLRTSATLTPQKGRGAGVGAAKGELAAGVGEVAAVYMRGMLARAWASGVTMAEDGGVWRPVGVGSGVGVLGGLCTPTGVGTGVWVSKPLCMEAVLTLAGG